MTNDNVLEDISIFKKYQKKRTAHRDQITKRSECKKWFSDYCHKRLERILQFVIPPRQRVMQVGCGQGDLLSSLKLSYAVGIDFSPEMFVRTREHHPQLHFIESDDHEFDLGSKVFQSNQLLRGCSSRIEEHVCFIHTTMPSNHPGCSLLMETIPACWFSVHWTHTSLV